MLPPGSPRTVLSRGAGRSPIWFVPTPRGPAALALDHDDLLDRDAVFLEDTYFPDADACSRRAAAFLRDSCHDALPRYVDEWTARDRTIHQYSAQSGWDSPVRHILTSRTVGVDGSRYLQQHRMHGAGLPSAIALRIVERLADACRLAHAAGVVHAGILLQSSVRVRPDGRPVLECWGSGRRGVGNVGCDHEGLWYGVRDVLGTAPPGALPEGDVFALGSLLSLLITGAPAYERGSTRWRYRAPSSRAEAFAWLDAVVGRACDPSRGFTMSAGALRDELASLLVERRPALDRVRADLRRADLGTFAELVACEDEPTAGELAQDVCDTTARDVLGALQRERAVPRFTELALAVCPQARPLVREFALDRSRASLGRLFARRLLTMIDDERALDIAMAASAEEPDSLPQVGWSARPQLITADGVVCPHPWSSLRGEPSFNEHGSLQRECPECKTVQLAHSWLGERSRRVHTPLTSFPASVRLSLESAQGVAVSELVPGVPQRISPEPGSTLCVEGLDPADRADFRAIDSFRVVFVLGTTAFEDGSELRAAALDTRRSDPEALRIGPLQFVATAPGEVTVRADAGVHVTLRYDPGHDPSFFAHESS